MPGVWQATADILLKAVEVGKGKQGALVPQKPLIDALLGFVERLQLAGMIVQFSGIASTDTRIMTPYTDLSNN